MRRRFILGGGLLLGVVLLLAACSDRGGDASEPCVAVGESGTCAVDGYPDRPYLAFVPTGYDGGPVPVVVELHGGGGKADPTSTCPRGDVDDPLCLHGVGEAEGFVTVYPNGYSPRSLLALRTWNAGGGVGGWNCSSGKSCENGIDDVAYLDAVLGDLSRRLNVDSSRVYVTGLSNGAAMSHRLACERSDVFAAIVAVAGSNQYSTGADCSPSRPVPVMQIHGTDDPCWTFDTSGRACLTSQDLKLGAVESAEVWARTNGCGSGTDGPIVDDQPDRTAVQRRTWSRCDGGVEVVVLSVIGGGHTWPNGDPGLGRIAGEISTEIDSSTVWRFMKQWSIG